MIEELESFPIKTIDIQGTRMIGYPIRPREVEIEVLHFGGNLKFRFSTVQNRRFSFAVELLLSVRTTVFRGNLAVQLQTSN